MKLAGNTTTEKETTLYIANNRTELSLIYISNTTAGSITINLFIEFADLLLKIIPPDTILDPAEEALSVIVPYNLEKYDLIKLSADAPGLQFLIQGKLIGNELYEIIRESLLTELQAQSDIRYYRNADVVGLNRIENPDNTADVVYDGQTFINTYFNFATASLTFTGGCKFYNCYVKNTFGTIDFGDSVGFVPLSTALTIPDTLTGQGGVDPDNF